MFAFLYRIEVYKKPRLRMAKIEEKCRGWILVVFRISNRKRKVKNNF